MRAFFARLFSSRRFVPAQFKDRKITNIPLLAVDLELTSLRPQDAMITSIAWIKGQDFSTDLNTAFYTVVKANGDLQQSPVIHGLSAKDLAQGAEVRPSIERLCELAKDHVLVFHNASLDMHVLQTVAERLKLPTCTVTCIDTMQLERYLLTKTDKGLSHDALILSNCRARYHLPKAPDHNALDDANATLELLYAILYHMDKQAHICLGDLKHSHAIQVHTIGVEPSSN